MRNSLSTTKSRLRMFWHGNLLMAYALRQQYLRLHAGMCCFLLLSTNSLAPAPRLLTGQSTQHGALVVQLDCMV